MLFIKSKKEIIYAPLSGQCISLDAVPDEAFSQKMMGEGMAIIPTEGKVLAPFDGYTSIVSDTHHALGLTSNKGLELLIHVGLETVNLNGLFYTMRTAEKRAFKKGDLLLEFDISAIQNAGYNIVTPVTVTNYEDFEPLIFFVNQSENSVLLAGDDFMQAIKKGSK